MRPGRLGTASAHPWLAEVRGGRRVPGPHTVALYERMLSAVADTGLTPAEVIAVVGLVGRFLDSEALLLWCSSGCPPTPRSPW